MRVFEATGKENTKETLQIAFAKAAQIGSDVVVATSSGASALTAMEIAKEENFQGRVIVVRNATTAAMNGVNMMPEETREELIKLGAVMVHTANALSAGERSISTTFKGQYPLEIVAAALRMISQGTKVCVEVSTMAMDTDALKFGQRVVAVGGTGHGLDTACVLSPQYSSSILNTKIHEILCKPGLY